MALDSISQNLGRQWFREQSRRSNKEKTRKKRGGRRRKENT